MQITASCYLEEFNPTVVVNGYRRLRFSIDDLAHAMFTVGRAPGDRMSHGFSSVYEWLHRVAMIPAYLRITQSGGLSRSPLAKSLDRSEKVGLSYAMGQAMTSVFCVSEVGVQYMMHYDRYERHFRINTSSSSKQRPDLIGLTHARDWVVAEAKGRSVAMESALRDTLIQQKQVVASINGVAPLVAIGCVASFPPPSGELRVNAIDPPETSKEAISLEAPDDSFLLAYYSPMVAALDLGEQSDNDMPGFETVHFTSSRLEVSLLQEIADAVRAARSDQTGLAAAIGAALERARGGDDSAYTDGFRVSGDWNDELRLQNES